MKWHEREELKKRIDLSGTDLLVFHQTAEWNAVDRFGVQKNIMITISMTLIAAGAAAVSSDRQIIVWSAMLLPVFVAVLRQYAIETLDRYYARFLEAVVVQRKLRFICGLGSDVDAPFEEDEFLDVARRGSKAPQTGSGLWVREFLMGGHNGVVWRIFRALCWASAMLPLAAAARLGTWPSDAAPSSALTAPGALAVVVASLVALGAVYAAGTRCITEKRDHSYGRLPSKAMQGDRLSAGR